MSAAALPDKVSLEAAFAAFQERWSPKIVADVNDVQVKLAKFEGDFVWHRHDTEDELFLVVRGRLRMRFRDHEVDIEAGELIVVPAGVEHCPSAARETHVMLLERAGTVNTGSAGGSRTVAAERLT